MAIRDIPNGIWTTVLDDKIQSRLKKGITSSGNDKWGNSGIGVSLSDLMIAFNNLNLAVEPSYLRKESKKSMDVLCGHRTARIENNAEIPP